MRVLRLAFALLPLLPGSAFASYIVALESNEDRSTNEVFFVSYPTFDDLVNNTNFTGVFGAININSAFSMGGLTYDGQFRMALESNADRATNEVFFLTYPTFDDLVNNTNFTGEFGDININSLFSSGGLAYDGQYRLALESDADRATNEVFFLTYPTFGDLVNNTNFTGEFGDININSLFSMGGLTYDGQYRLALESNADRATNEVFFLTYPTLTDLVDNTNFTGEFGDIDINGLFSMGGLAFVPAPPPPNPIPLPAGLPLLVTGLGLLGLWCRGRRSAALA